MLFAVGLHFDVDVAVGGAHYAVGHAFGFLADLIELASHESFDGKNRIGGIRDGLSVGGVTDEAFTALAECDDRRRGPLAFRVLQNHWISAFHDGHAGIRCS
mgnify:CR=1 FL=1